MGFTVHLKDFSKKTFRTKQIIRLNIADKFTIFSLKTEPLVLISYISGYLWNDVWNLLAKIQKKKYKVKQDITYYLHNLLFSYLPYIKFQYPVSIFVHGVTVFPAFKQLILFFSLYSIIVSKVSIVKNILIFSKSLTYVFIHSLINDPSLISGIQYVWISAEAW